MENQSYSHLYNIIQLALNYTGSVNDRQLALIDVNKDLFLIALRTTGFGKICKIGM
jgi:intraflagellar transport protein 80